MQGVIRGRQVCAHPFLIAHLYGPRVFARVLWALVCGKRCTFLQLAGRV